MALPVSAETVFLHIGEESRSLGRAIEFLEDPGGKLTIGDVSSPAFSSRFQRSNRTAPCFGLGDTVYWLRFRIADRNQAPSEWLLEQPFPLMKSFDLYTPSSIGGYNTQRYFYGPDAPWAPLPHRNPFFSLPVTSVPTTFYLRASVGSILAFPVVVKSRDTFMSQNSLSLLCYGLYFGAMLTMALYNLYLSITFRDRVYFYFTAYIILFSLLQMSLHGFLRQYLFPIRPDLDNQALRFLILAPSIASLLFSRRFLDAQKNAPFMDHCLLVLIGVDVILVFTVPFLPVLTALKLLNLETLIAALLATTAGISCYLNGFRPARYYLMARICFYVSLCIFALNNILFHTHNFISWYGMMLGSLLEVTLLSKALAERINDMLQEKERMEAEMIRSGGRALVGELAAGVAHEVNNPLAGVMLCFNGILSLKEGDPLRDELITSVKSGLARIRGTVAQLLNFSRVADTEIRPVELRSLVDSALALCRYQLDKANIEIKLDMDHAMPPVPLDEMKMGQVLVNLLLNARNAMPDGGRLTIRSLQDAGWCELSVTDTGIGITPEIMPKIFDPFFSTRLSGEGTGLGLSICKNIVEAHGGTIQAESVTGSGSCFLVRIPL